MDEAKRQALLLAQCRRGLKRNGIEELEAEEIVRRAIEDCRDRLTLGWSGGKCSTICLHMALKHKPGITVIYNNTGIEFPENVKYVHQVAEDWHVNLTEFHPDITFWEIVKKYGFPQFSSKSWGQKRRSLNMNSDRRPMCCYLLKEKKRYSYYKDHGVLGDIVGLRAGESRVRAIHIGKRGQIYTIKRPMPMNIYVPIALWTNEQCEEYIQENDIPYNHTYDTQTRNGCWACTAYKGWKRNILRYNPRMYQLVQKMQGVMLMDDYIPNLVPCEVMENG